MAGSTHIVSGSYERIAKKIFTELNYAPSSFLPPSIVTNLRHEGDRTSFRKVILLGYDTDRAGNFEPLRHLLIGKNVVLGVVSSKDPALEDLEDLDELVERVDAAADAIARGQGRIREEVVRDVLGVSPQCGFASTSKGGGIGMREERMWEKLVLYRELAARIWPDEVVRI